MQPDEPANEPLALEVRVRDELARTAHPAKDWVLRRQTADGRHVHPNVQGTSLFGTGAQVASTWAYIDPDRA